MTGHPLPGFHMLVPVWGAAFRRMFAEISLPSQLSPGNLPALPHGDRCLYHLFTTAGDASWLDGQAAMARLRSLMPVRVTIIDRGAASSHALMSECLRQGVWAADDVDAASLFVNPDFVVADGTYAALARLAAAGRRVVFTTGIRLLKESVEPELAARRDGDGVLAIAPRELVEVAMRHLHPISTKHFWDDGEGDLIPANLFWTVADEGLLAHCFHLHPLLVYPECKRVVFGGTVDDDFVEMACPSGDDHVVTDSDDLLVCEISGWHHRVETRFRKGVVDDLVTWAEANTDSRHRRLVRVPIRFHSTATTEPLWNAAEHAAKAVVDTVSARLAQPWGQLIFKHPLRAIHRLVKRAREAEVVRSNRVGGTHGAAAAMPRWLTRPFLDGFNAYRDWCAGYVGWRQRVDTALCGPVERPHPWSAGWLGWRRLARAAAAEVTAGGRTLLLSEDDGVTRCLAAAFPEATRVAWPLAGVAADPRSDECWPFADDAFDTILCLSALNRAPEPRRFLAELGRVLAPGGRAVVSVPFLARAPLRPGGDFWRLSVDAAPLILPPSLRVSGLRRSGGLGTVIAGLLFAWGEDMAERLRLSPVVVEIPLLPLLLPARAVAGALLVGLATILDRVDRSQRYYADTIMVVERRPPQPES